MPPRISFGHRRRRFGVLGERIAADFLRSLGFLVLQRGFRAGRHEIDLIVRRGRQVAFVEVKARRSRACGTAAAAVTARKRWIVSRVAAVWVDRHGQAGDCYRFDVVAVECIPGRGPEVTHVAGAWWL